MSPAPQPSGARGGVVQGFFPGRVPRLPVVPSDGRGAHTLQTRPLAPHVSAALGNAALGRGAGAPDRSVAPHTVQRSAPPQAFRPTQVFELPPGLLPTARGGGRSLPEVVQRKMEAVFGADLSDVRIHVGHQAATLGATAFTHGSNIFFAPGHYDPTTPRGQQLLGHELTHVLQQRSGRVRNPLASGVAVVQDPGMEAEAERMSIRVAHAREPIRAKREPVGRPAGAPTVQPSRLPGARRVGPTLAAQPKKPAPVTRPLAPHVQAAVGGLQPRLPQPPAGSRPLAPHVQAALAAAQAKAAAPHERPIAAHVQAAVARAQGPGRPLQPAGVPRGASSAAPPLTPPLPRAGGSSIQRAELGMMFDQEAWVRVGEGFAALGSAVGRGADWLARVGGDYLVTKGRRRERQLARRTFRDAGIRRELVSAFRKLRQYVNQNDDRLGRGLDTSGRYAYAYSGYQFRLTHKLRFRTVREIIEKTQGKIERQVDNEKLANDIVALFTSAARNFKTVVREEMARAQDSDEERDVAFKNRIEGDAGTLRSSWKLMKEFQFRGRSPLKTRVYGPSFNSAQGPSATMLDILNLANMVGCTRTEMRALAWGQFAWWRTKWRGAKAPGLGYHTFKETMMTLNNYLGETFYDAVPDRPSIEERDPAPENQPNYLAYR